jgi:hypothetical protein
VNILDVPGGTRETNVTAGMRQMDKNLQRYRDKRQAGERPGSITKKGMDKSEKLQDLWENHETSLIDENDPETVKKVKRSLINTE